MHSDPISAAQPSCPLASSANLVTQNLGREILVYKLKTNQAYCLNETAAQVWQLCDGTKTVPEISRSLTRKLNSEVSEDVVRLALDYLDQHELLDESSRKFSFDFNGLSRREMIKKAGLATMVALPTITFLVAPQASQAASGGASSSGACTNNCAVAGLACSCPTGSVTCAPGTTVSATIGAGVCVSAAVAASTLGVSVGAGVNGNVCLVAAACVL